MKIVYSLSFILFFGNVIAQEDEDWDKDPDADEQTEINSFYDTRVVNGHSTEVLDKNTLDFRVSHKFGTLATAGAYHRFFGLDNSSDIRIAFEYGLFKNFNIGFGRSKGAGPYTELFDGYAKYKILQQTDKMPISMAVVGSSFASGMKSDGLDYSVTNFTKFSYRFSYYSQLIVSKNFGDRVSLQLAPGVSYRNLVYYQDKNLLFCMGGVIKLRLTKKMAIMAEYYHAFRKETTFLGTQFVDPLGFGIEFKTHAHVFQINITNSAGFGEGQFIPYTRSKYSQGEFRLGFKISRHF